MADSLVIGEQIELIGAGGAAIDPYGTPSTNPLCTGAVFRLLAPFAALGNPSWNLGAPQPTTDIVGSLLLDGERPFGYRASNRTITLPVIIKAPTFQALIAAREVLLKEVDQQTFSLRWTRDTAGPLAGNATPLPLLFDCFRAQPTIYEWGGFYHKIPYGVIYLTFSALPYARSDTPQIVDFQSPLAGRSSPPSAVTLDAYSSATGGAQWATSSIGPTSSSVYWSPAADPMDIASGIVASPPSTGIVNANYNFGGTGSPSSATWNGSNGTVTAIANGSLPGTPPWAENGLEYVNGGVSAGSANETGTGGPVTCISGQSFLISAWLYSSVTSVTLGADFNSSGGFLSTQIGTFTVTANTWTFLQYVITTPPRGVNFTTRFGSGTVSATIYGQHVTANGVVGATFARGQLSANLGAGYSVACAASGTTTTAVVSASSAAAADIDIEQNFMLYASGVPVSSQIYEVAAVSAPSGGNVTVTFFPAAPSGTTTSDSLVQTNPPQLNALTLYAGFGSTLYYHYWARLGGRVTFAFTFTDAYANQIMFSHTVKITGSNDSGNPRWTKIRVPIPATGASENFDFLNVAGYVVSVTNRSTGDLRYTNLYLDSLSAVPPPTPLTSPQRGTVYDLAGMAGSARAPVSLQFQQSGTTSVTKQLTIVGNGQWLCPAGVTSVNVFCVGGGGDGSNFMAGNGGGGGGGGGSAANAAVAVTAGQAYSYTVGAFGSGGGNGGNSTFTGNSVTVTAHGGTGAGTSSTGGAGGTAGTGGFAGGAGGNGTAGSSGGGGAGGGSGGSAAGGNAGGAASGGTGGTPGAAVTGGGIGGRGGTLNVGNGNAPVTGYGGGGGGSPAGGFGRRDNGGFGSGLVQLTYSVPASAQTLIAHRPPVTAPEMLVPFVSPNIGDLPNGGIEYPIPTLTPGVNAKFSGTYTVVVVAYSWNTVSASRTITVGVNQYEQAGGAKYTTSVSTTVTPNTLPNTTATNAQYGPFVVVGELTLPVNDIAPDNVNAYFTVTLTDTNTSDDFIDILFLDTQGSTVIIMSPTSYANFYLDEPPSDRDIGYILGTLYDRADAVSVLDRTIIAGPPMSVDPVGNPTLLAYAAEGAPNMQMIYYPRWWLDRYQ